jgi:hypothetical protein
MDSNTLYNSAMIGEVALANDEIIKSVWKEDSFENMTAMQAEDLCGSLGDSVYGKCMNAANQCGADGACDAVAKKYAKALGKGYQGSFEDFKKRSKSMGDMGQIALGFLGNFLGKIGSGGSNEQESYSDDSYSGGSDEGSSKTGLFVAVGALALIGIGVGIYFATKK